MKDERNFTKARALGFSGLLLWILIAALAFHLAYASANACFFVVLYLFALLRLAQADKWRTAFYSGLAVGVLIAAGHLDFFWRLFSAGAMALWLVYAVWLGLFVAIARLCWLAFGPKRAWLLVPFVWIGLEYSRSELYYLRFSWLNPAYAFAEVPRLLPFHRAGIYGVDFLLVTIASIAAVCWKKSRVRSLAALVSGAAVICICALVGGEKASPVHARVRISGVQMEFPTENEVVSALNALLSQYPDTELVVLSEYTFTEPIPTKVKDWCRQNNRYLIVGGEDPAAHDNFYDTAFVIGPSGDIVFRQAKSVPIQFFKDGLPAAKQELWDSPWGRFGLCICYDLSYRRVTDRLVKLGAQALIVPTMDVLDWGKRQHELHARIAPLRAAEYGIPIFRVASSGISQSVDATGRTVSMAPCPGQDATLSDTVEIRGAGRLPADRWLAPLGTGLTAVLIVWLLVRQRFVKQPDSAL